ncbi:MAG: hypothetical protein RI965_893 [Bacteroidota bacterium]|jgi:hypothetical protein
MYLIENKSIIYLLSDTFLKILDFFHGKYALSIYLHYGFS